MEIVDNKAVVFKTRAPHKYQVIPRSKVLGEVEDGVYEVAVYFGMDEMRVLKNLGVKNAPSPITAKYTWPGRYKPFAHQKETAAFLTMNRRAFVFSEPGTGKTLAALWAADYLMNLGEIRRVLILCPLSIMRSAWVADISSSVIHRSVAVAHHSDSKRRIEIVKGGYEFVIVNFDGLALVADTIESQGNFDLIIGDEANAWKNVSTKRWKTLHKLIKPNTYLWLMTGTPAAQSPEDAYGLAKLVNPTGVPQFFSGWRDKVMNKVTAFRWMPKKDAYDQVYAALQPAIRYTKAQCLDLPPVVTTTREVELTLQQSKYYKLLKNKLLFQAAGEQVTAVNAASVVNKLLQISAGAAYTDDREVVEFDCSPRFNVLMEAVQETQRKVLVFANYRHSIDTIADHFNREGIGCAKITGDVTPNTRTELFRRFQQESDIRVLVIQPQAAQHGVTLTAADTIVFWGPVMSVETYIQCIARGDRVGQDSDKVTVVHIQGSDIERKMFKKLEGRVNDNRLLLDIYEDMKNSI